MANASFVTSSRIKSMETSSGNDDKDANTALKRSMTTNDARLESPLVVGRQAATRLFDFCTEAWSKDSHHARPKDMCSYRYRMDSGEITATVILRLPGRSNPMVVPNSQNWFRNRSNAQNAAALRALVELGVARRPTKREEDAIFGDNLMDFHKMVAEEQQQQSCASSKTVKNSTEKCTTAVGRAPPQFNGPFAQYKAPMLPHPRWVGKPTWRSLKSSKSASPVSSIGSYDGCAEPTPKSYPGYLSHRQNSGDASTLADSESSVSIRNGVVDGMATVDRFGMRHGHHASAEEAAAVSPHGCYYYAEDGYYQAPVLQEVTGPQHHHQQQQAYYYQNNYYHSPMHSGVYYSIAAQPLSASPDGGSPYADSSSPYSMNGYASTTPTTTVTQDHTPQFFNNESGGSGGHHVASQQHTVAAQYSSVHYHHHHPHHHHQQQEEVSRHNSAFSEGAAGRYCPPPTVYGHPQQQHHPSGICPMPTTLSSSQGCYNVAGIPPPPPPSHHHQSQYGTYPPHRGSWDNQGEMEVLPAAAANPTIYHPNGGASYLQPSQTGYEDYQPYYGHMIPYHNGGVAPPQSYGIHHNGYMMSSGGYLPYIRQSPPPPPPPSTSYQIDEQRHHNDAWTPRTGIEGYEV